MPDCPGLAGSPGLLAALAAVAHEHGGCGSPEVLYDRHGRLVVRVGTVVVRWSLGEAGEEMRRARSAAQLPEALPMLGWQPEVQGGTATVWPLGRPVDPEALPWQEAGVLLASLHGRQPRAGTPRWAGNVRLARKMAHLPDGDPAAAEVVRAHATLPPWVRDGLPSAGDRIIHGDWHLGQLVRDHRGDWRLIDLDTAGLGDPVWDLARPAGLLCAGLLDPREWQSFLGAYQESGGPGTEDALWASLEMPARALVVQMAATVVGTAHDQGLELDDRAAALVDTCQRIARSREPAFA